MSSYHVVSLLDRHGAGRTDRGGIDFFVRDGLQDSVMQIGNSYIDERSWHVMHAKSGPILVCVWYRNLEASEVASVKRFEQEYKQYSKYGVWFIAIWDFNVHNRLWLRYSTSDSFEGS